ncbi:MAG: ATP-grasp domain-containing protein [Oscillibacter sp.]
MIIAHNDEEVRRYMEIILSGKIENPVLVDQYLMGKELEVDVISDGTDVLIPGVMQHIERTGVHSGDSIAVYPPFSIGDKMLQTIVDCSEKLALSLKTRGLINIQYLIYQGELYVIEVNPRASRTVPYISKVTGVPDGGPGHPGHGGPAPEGPGLWHRPVQTSALRGGEGAGVLLREDWPTPTPPLSPEMKSTGEVLGLGANMQEALFKGLVSAGYKVEKSGHAGVLISVNRRDQPEIVNIARKLDEMGFRLYATDGTAREISRLGTDVEVVGKLGRDNRVFQLLESGRIDYVDPHRLYGAGVYPGLHPPEPPVRPAGHSLPDLAGYGRCPDGHPGQPLQPGEHGARRYLPSADGAAEAALRQNADLRQRLHLPGEFQRGDHLP